MRSTNTILACTPRSSPVRAMASASTSVERPELAGRKMSKVSVSAERVRSTETISRMAFSTSATVFLRTPPRALMTRSTVAVLTPARAATSATRGRRPNRGWSTRSAVGSVERDLTS
jgi:hypothetical protein